MNLDAPATGAAPDPGDDTMAADAALFEIEGPTVSTPRHLSPSSATLFAQCPRRWRYRYIDKLPEPVGEDALIGTFAHRVLELLLAEPPRRRTTERARSIARTVWPETARHPDFAHLGLDEAASRAFRWKGWSAIEGLWAVEDPTTVEVAATEHRVRAEVGGVPFLGVIDRLDRCDDGLVVTDYKSGRPPSRRFEADKLTQVLLYAAAVATEGEAPVRARLVYLGSRSLETPATDHAVADAVTALRATWDQLCEAVRTDTFDPEPGPLCGWCPHVARCPEGLAEIQRRHDEGRLRSDAPGAALVA
ncbi:MAG: PD-(D/E)XK nuclease family protein [Acidimicrobiales bacterium]|nr:PD-(D/E)XK nuclease family protein [Acidimicrobiales bacterium]